MPANRVIPKLLPAQIKYRLMLAFLLFILLPYTGFQLYSFTTIDHTIRANLVSQNREQLAFLKSSFEDMKVSIQNAVLLFENDPDMIAILDHPGTMPEETKLVKTKFADMENRIDFGNGFSVQFLLASDSGSLYMSYIPELQKSDRTFVGRPAIRAMLENPYLSEWSDAPMNDLLGRYAPGKEPYVTLSTTLKGNRDLPNALLFVFFDYSAWLKTSVAKFPVKQNYFLLNENGELLMQTEPAMTIESHAIRDMAARTGEDGLYAKSDGSSVISSIPLTSFRWQLGCQFDLNLFLGNIQQMKRQFWITMLGLTGLFLGLTALISSLVTRPLLQLKKNMLRTADSNFKQQMKENPYAGEIASLTHAYNQMIVDMDALIRKLKIEERQKEALRFQMLLTQMNPHFLLNTLNTIKWIALDHEEETIAEACVSLGMLLESSLASESELIFLKDEIELIRAYVHLQQIRYAGKLDISFAFDESLQFALAPKFGLQPLVENAIQHGITPLKRQGRIAIRAYAAGETLLLEVEDNGVGREASQSAAPRKYRKGIGLINLRERLALMFRGEAELTLESLAEGTLARMRLPLLLSNPYSEEEKPGADRISR